MELRERAARLYRETKPTPTIVRPTANPGTFTVTYPSANKYGPLTLTVKVHDDKASIIGATGEPHPIAARDAVTVVRNLTR